eukprot:scaffold291177_cov35-Prasinocladus_malaysianus.AAC.1
MHLLILVVNLGASTLARGSSWTTNATLSIYSCTPIALSGCNNRRAQIDKFVQKLLICKRIKQQAHLWSKCDGGMGRRLTKKKRA